MRQFPHPGEERAYIESINERMRQNRLKPQKESAWARRRKAVRQSLFEKAHPEIYREDTADIGQMIRINGEETEENRSQTRRYQIVYRLYRSWWKIMIAVILAILLIPVPVPVHRTLPAVLFSDHVEETDTLEIQGVIWKAVIWDRTFYGRIRGNGYDQKIKAEMARNYYDGWWIFLPYGDPQDRPQAFNSLWGDGETSIPAWVHDDFREIWIDGSKLNLAAPATNAAEAEEILDRMRW